MAGRIAVIGSNMMDLVTYVARMPERGETVEAPSFEMGHGGKGANQAVAAAKLGAEVVMVTKVGDDMFGDATIANLRRLGVDTRHVGVVAGRSSGVAPITVEPSGENSILIVKGANADLAPEDVERAADDLKTCDLILLQLEVPVETVYAALDFGRRHGIATLLNPAPALPTLDVARISSATFLVPNETELRILSGLPVGSLEEVEAAARSLMARGVGTVVVTLGARGALLVEAGGSTPIPAVAVAPVDTTGAGDAFIGSFARYHAAGRAVVESLHEAVRYAADSITRRGTQKAYATEAEFAAGFVAGPSQLPATPPPTRKPSPPMSHVTVGTNDKGRSAKFYDAVLGSLGFSRLPKAPEKPLAYERDGQMPTLYVYEPEDGRPATWGNGTHLALVADTRAQVHAFHEIALAQGGRSEGGPGPRPHYGVDYYAAYVRDPDGNKLQAVCYAAE